LPACGGQGVRCRRPQKTRKSGFAIFFDIYYDMHRLETIIDLLASGATLPPENHDHALHGSDSGCRECHVAPDWLLIYERNDKELLLILTRTGTHSDLF
jgi:mRNA interferase YafQ